MTVADHQVVGEVGFAAWKTSVEGEAGFSDPAVIEAARKAFFEYPAEARGDVAVAELEGRVVGWGARADNPDYISDIWVDPACQGRGICSALVRYFLERIQAESIMVAKIHTRSSNAGAIILYERCGFSLAWRGKEFDAGLGIPLEKVHLEMQFGK